MGHIFISYSRKDEEYVNKLVDALENEGFEVWIDRELLTGDAWTQVINNKIDTCDAFVIVMTDASKESTWVRREVLYAIQESKKILPLLLQGKLWMLLQDFNFFRVTDGSIPDRKFFNDIEKTIPRSEAWLAAQREAAEKAENEADENVRLEPIKVTSRWNALGRMVLVSVWSSSEEAGRQIFIANLAAQAALTGMRVGLADTDFALPTAQSMFGLDKPDTLKTINDYLYGRATIGEVGLPIHESNGQISELKDTHIWLFPASVNPGELLRIQREGIDIGMLRDGFRDAYEKFNLDCLFINLPSNVNEETLLGIAISNVAIIVVRPDNLDYARTAAMIDTARKFEIPNVFLAVNNVLPKYDKYDFTEVKSRLEQTYDTPVLGMLPLFDDIVDDGNAGMFSINSPSHKWSRGLCSLAQSLFETKI